MENLIISKNLKYFKKFWEISESLKISEMLKILLNFGEFMKNFLTFWKICEILEKILKFWKNFEILEKF